jgi:hypothetical protein
LPFFNLPEWRIFFGANPAIIPKKIGFGKVLLAQKGTSVGRSF